MTRKLLVAMAFAIAGLLLQATSASASETAVPESVGMMPAVDPADTTPGSPVAPLLQVAGLVLLLGGGVTVARSWVSTVPAV